LLVKTDKTVGRKGSKNKSYYTNRRNCGTIFYKKIAKKSEKGEFYETQQRRFAAYQQPAGKIWDWYFGA
jgi:hypothetical protein